MLKQKLSSKMEQKTSTRKKFPLPKVFGTKEKKASPRRSIECSVNSTDDFKDSPLQSQVASSSSSSSSFFKSFSESRSMKLGSFSSHASTTSTHTESLRIFAATWNVAGKTPNMELNLNDFLPSDDHSDIYVLGFQEVVPLNAGNVLVIEDNAPAARWLALINQALNRPSPADDAPSTSISDTSASYSFCSTDYSTSTPPFHKNNKSPFTEARRRRLEPSCTCPAPARPPRRRPHITPPCLAMSCTKNQHHPDTSTSSDDDEEEDDVDVAGVYEASIAGDGSDTISLVAPAMARERRRYSVVACKQMVGLFVTVWARREVAAHVGHVQLRCVGRGIMGRLGNKGCISVSMSVHRTSVCFVCSHLASGEKEGDELRRNSDVVEILRNTRFRRLCKTSGRRIIPEMILDHDRVIWLGDLNYRIALSYSETKKLVEANDWGALFEKDQLRMERESGVFRGWKEGKISFAPTYKYSWNSDTYTGEGTCTTSKKKRRTPAWCDRILWRGEGMEQVSYIRGESRFSDHRPVCAVFVVEVVVVDTKRENTKVTNMMKVGAEELCPLKM